MLWIDKWVWDTRRRFSALFLPYCKLECEGYKVLDSADRKNTYALGGIACDDEIEEAWYRQMKRCVACMHQGGWMDDIHPLPRERCTDHNSQNNKFLFLGNSYIWTLTSVWRKIILGYLPTNIFSEKRMTFEERSFRKAVGFGDDAEGYIYVYISKPNECIYCLFLFFLYCWAPLRTFPYQWEHKLYDFMTDEKKNWVFSIGFCANFFSDYNTA